VLFFAKNREKHARPTRVYGLPEPQRIFYDSFKLDLFVGNITEKTARRSIRSHWRRAHHARTHTAYSLLFPTHFALRASIQGTTFEHSLSIIANRAFVQREIAKTTRKLKTTRQPPEEVTLLFQIQIRTVQAHTDLQFALKLESPLN
jgi:hypothetical protein